MTKRLLFAPSLEDVNRMIEAAENPRGRLLIRLLACCGLRESELVGNSELDIPGLYLSDINWENKRLVIRGKGWRTGKVPAMEQPIDAVTLKMVEEYVRSHNIPQEGKLFDISPRYARYIVKQAAVKAGVPNAESLSPHRLRAFFITRIIENYDIETARRLARHKDIRSTQKYSFLAIEKIQQRYESIFEGQKTELH